ncbi:MAG: response regulator [Kofleriaceae bacterium]
MTHSIHILLVEDNPGDVDLTMIALEHGGVPSRLHVAEDGAAALAYLEQGADLPDLILLDLNLPKKSGHEVLAEIKRSPTLQHIPVIVLSSSASDADIHASYALHANSYVTKPATLTQYLTAVEGIREFWTKAARLPRC